MNVIDIKGLTKTYGDFCLDALTLALPEGKTLGLIGESGAGKTTLIRLLLGMAKPDAGTAAVLGTDIAEDLSAVKQDIGVIMGEPGLPQCLTVQEVGELMAGLYKSFDADYFAALLKRFALAGDNEYGKLSRGDRMKLGMALTLAHKPRLLIFDEPSDGLEPDVRDGVLGLLGTFAKKEGHSLLIASRNVSGLEQICDSIAFIRKGKLLLCGEKDALTDGNGQRHATFEELFDFMAKEEEL